MTKLTLIPIHQDIFRLSLLTIILFWLFYVSDVVEKVQKSAVRTLYQLVKEVTEGDASGMLFGQVGTILLEEFITNMNLEFDDLMGRRAPRDNVVDFETLSLVQDEELTAMVAMEGMIAAARNQHLPSFISFNTRLNKILADQQIRVDEASNPLDPQQIAGAFTTAIKGLGRSPRENLVLYRRFNEIVLKHLDQVLHEANQILITHGVIPKLGMEADTRQTNNTSAVRAKPRQGHKDIQGFGMVEEDPFVDAESENPELFSMMQNLLRRDSPMQRGASQTNTGARQRYAVPASLLAAGMTNDLLKPAAGEAVEMVDQQTLMTLLTNIQKSLDERDRKEIPNTVGDVEKLDVNGSLTEILQQGESGSAQVIDQQSADVINLVSLLFDAIWKDDSLAIPIKELIGRTQVTIIKVALSDTTFFNRENHPARRILNEFAEAGLGWTEVEHLNEDPLYQKIRELVNKLMADYNGEISFFDELVQEFKQFRAQEAAKTHRLEQRIMRAKERKERLDDIHELVTRKIAERVLGRDLQSFVQELLDTIYHKFMVMLVIKEGPGSNAWKQCVNTIDVLLWSVQPKDQTGDRVRLETVNPRLLNNLRKAFRIAQVESIQVDSLISQLMQVQEASLLGSELAQPQTEEPTGYRRDLFENEVGETVAAVAPAAPAAGSEDLADDDPDMQRVDKLGVGVWVEFLGEDDQSIRCKLAAKINAIDKYIFVNRQGVKVVEKTRKGLARELKDGTVKMISDGLLFSRALEAVIGNLRIAQQEQQTGGAYQPAERT